MNSQIISLYPEFNVSSIGKPQVGYSTALDMFIILCFITVFAALVEFAILNFIDTIMRRIKKQDREKQKVAFLLNQAQNHFLVQDNDSDGMPDDKYLDNNLVGGSMVINIL